MLTRAYALLDIKSVDDDQRIVEGIATTPTPDRAGDVMDMRGARFTLPIPFLWQHDQKQPIGEVFDAVVTDTGIAIKARIAKVLEPGPLRTRLDDAYQTLKAGIVRGLSIGFRAIDAEPIRGSGNGFAMRVKSWDWAELSAVSVPQNLEATILRVKSCDWAASGHNPSGVSDILPVVRVLKDAPTMPPTTTEQITSFESTRAAKFARMQAIMAAASEKGETLDQVQTEEYDGLTLELKSIDAHLTRLRDQERFAVSQATPIIQPRSSADGSSLRGGAPVVSVKSNVAKGTAFVRIAQALAACGGARFEASQYAQKWRDTTPEVELYLKAAVAAGNTTDATWAGPLAQLQPLTNEFLELLRPATVIGKIPNLRNVPFNISIPAQTGGGSYNWVGQGLAKPVSKLAFATITLGITKCAGIIVITEELARLSTPSAEQTIRNDMIAGIAAFLDVEFTDPAKAPVAGVSPGSIANGVTPLTSAGTSPANARTDIQAMAAAMTAANISTVGAVLLMSETNALALGSALNPLGEALFPALGAQGGTALGFPVIASQALANHVELVSAPNILFADDGGVTIDVSREASVQMDSAPDSPPLATTILTSLWQNNLVGLRAERFINWKSSRTGAVQLVNQTYVAA